MYLQDMIHVSWRRLSCVELLHSLPDFCRHGNTNTLRTLYVTKAWWQVHERWAFDQF